MVRYIFGSEFDTFFSASGGDSPRVDTDHPEDGDILDGDISYGDYLHIFDISWAPTTNQCEEKRLLSEILEIFHPGFSSRSPKSQFSHNKRDGDISWAPTTNQCEEKRLLSERLETFHPGFSSRSPKSQLSQNKRAEWSVMLNINLSIEELHHSRIFNSKNPNQLHIRTAREENRERSGKEVRPIREENRERREKS